MIPFFESTLARFLAVATLLGGVAAVFYLCDIWRKKRLWVEKEKEINSAWWESSELKIQYEVDGYKDFHWSNSDLVPMRVTEGKEIIYEIDEKNRVKYKLVNKSGQVLLGRNAI